MALIFGIIIMIGVLCLVAVIAVLLFRRRGSNGKLSGKTVPPPVDPGPAHPEQSRDVNADKTAAKAAAKQAGKLDPK